MSERENEIGGRGAGVLEERADGLPERDLQPGTGRPAMLEARGSTAERLESAEHAIVEEHWLADGVVDVGSVPAPAPSVVIVDADAGVRAALLEHLAPACAAHDVEPSGAVALLQGLACVDVALIDCDPPPSQQAPIFRALSRWPGAVCVLMSQNPQKVEQLRALGLFAPLVLDKPLQPEALDAIRAAVLEIAEGGPA